MRLRLCKTKESLPDWFPLDIYSQELNGKQWLEELVLRLSVRTIYRNTADSRKALDGFRNLILKKTYGGNEGETKLLETVSNFGELLGVQDIPAFYVSYLASMLGDTEPGRQLAEEIKLLRKKKNSEELFNNPSELVQKSKKNGFSEWINWDSEPYEMPDVLPSYPVIVDLDQDDESLQYAFKLWLVGARAVLGEAPKPISQRDFDDWKKFKVLQVSDLLFWAELNELKYTDALIANTVWPYTDVDNTERLRKVTKPKIKQIFDDWRFLTRFWRQMELSVSLEKLLEKME